MCSKARMSGPLLEPAGDLLRLVAVALVGGSPRGTTNHLTAVPVRGKVGHVLSG